jgi:hypothetical protein
MNRALALWIAGLILDSSVLGMRPCSIASAAIFCSAFAPFLRDEYCLRRRERRQPAAYSDHVQYKSVTGR